MILHHAACMILPWQRPCRRQDDRRPMELYSISAEYKNKTTLIITCDHGRGDNPKENWQHHGEKIEDAGQIWIAAIGPDTRPAGEMKNKNLLYQKQLAATFAKFLGFTFTADHPVADPVENIYK